MRSNLAKTLVLFALIVGTQCEELRAQAAPDQNGDSQRDWTNQDSVRIRDIATKPSISPDGSKFFFVVTRGDLNCDCNIAELSVYSAARVLNALSSQRQSLILKPDLHLIRASTAQNAGEFQKPEWSRDSRRIIFEGSDHQGRHQVFALNASTGVLDQLTQFPKGEFRGLFRHGDVAVGLFDQPRANPLIPKYPVQAVSDLLLRSVGSDVLLENRTDTFVQGRRGGAWKINGSNYLPNQYPTFSDSGALAVMVRSQAGLPPEWQNYSLFRRGLTSEDLEEGKVSRFVLIDLNRRRTSPILNAPSGTSTEMGAKLAASLPPTAFWMHDQQHVVLVNAALPLSPDQDERSNTAYVVGYDVSSGAFSAIEPLQQRVQGKLLQVSKVVLSADGKTLEIHHQLDGSVAETRRYVATEGGWLQQPGNSSEAPPASRAQAALPAGLRIEVRESVNDPQAVVASWKNRTISLLPPDPVLEHVWRAQTRPFSWLGANGNRQVGGLLLPRKGTAPFPLVIQAYSYNPGLFEPDGPAKHAYAAQTLVGRGYAVLNMNIPSMQVENVMQDIPRENALFVGDLDGAISALVEQHLVDQKRIALIGFSRAGFNTRYAISHPSRFKLSAAIIDDGFPGTFGYQNIAAAQGNPGAGFYKGNFWQNKSTWLENDSIFNVDRISTPTLFTIHKYDYLQYMVETVGAFKMNRVPMDLWVFPNGAHQLSMPRQRLASQNLSVDWIDFWLFNRKDLSVEKRDQYIRWERIRESLSTKASNRLPEPMAKTP